MPTRILKLLQDFAHDLQFAARQLRRSPLLVTGLGLATGMVLALQVGRLLTSLLAGVQGLQLAILLAATSTVALVSMLAVYIPARRAATVDPGQALRSE